MFTVIVETQKDGEEQMGEEGFLARLETDETGAIRHHFALEVVNYNNRRAFAMLAEPGEIFEARRWRLDEEVLVGGDLWFTISLSGAVYPLSRQEALDAVHSARHGNDNGSYMQELFSGFSEYRMQPTDIFCRRNDIVPQAPPARPLD